MGVVGDIVGSGVEAIVEGIFGIDQDESYDADPVPTTPTPTDPPSSYTKISPFDPSTAGLPIMYGTRRTEGLLILSETGASDGEDAKELYQFFALSEGPIGSVTPYSEPDGEFLKATTQRKGFLGADGGIDSDATWTTTLKSNIITSAPSVTSALQSKGVASYFFRHTYNLGETGLQRNPKKYFIVSGRTITGNDDNPANILYDYMTNTRYGAGISSSLIDTTAYESARDYCDATVTSGGKRFTAGLLLSSKASVLDNIKVILSTFMGQLHFINGKYYMHIDKTFSGTPVVDFDFDNIIGNIAITSDTKNSRANQCIATWTNPDDEYRASEVAWPDPNNETSTYNAYLTADNNLPLVKKISITSVTNFQQARYIAMVTCKKSRQNTKVSLNTTAESANIIPGDIVTLTLASMGWSSKEFRAITVAINPDGSIKITMVEHQDSFYAEDTGTAPSTVSRTTIRNPANISAVSGLTATETLYNTREGSGVKSKVTLTWNEITDNFLDAYEVSYKLSSASDFEPVGDTKDSTIEIFDIGVGTFDFRVISRAIEGATSASATTTLTTTGLDAVPAQITNFFVNSMGTVAVAQWDVSTDMDVRQGGYYVIAHSIDSSANTWDECIPITPQVAGQQTSVIVPLLAGAYAIRATDSSGQKGMPTFFQSDGTSLQPLSVVGNVTEDSAFSGTKNKVEAPDGVLKIVSESDLDDISDVDAIVQWDALSGIYNTSSSGYSSDKPMYTFANTFDLGSSQRVRLRRYLKVYSSVWSDLIDNRATNIDSWTDFDNTDSGVTSVKMQMRSTADDPSSGSASWGEWSDFYIEEITKRGFQFRVFPETTDSDYNINIQECRVYAEQLSS